MDRRGFVVLGAAVSAFLLAALVLSPFLSPYGTYTHLDGYPSQMDHGWGASGFMYALGDLLCHQQADRSFFLNGNQLPFCIRDTGLLAGFTVGMSVCAFLDRRLADRRFCIAGIALMAVTVVQWISQNFTPDMPWIRFASAVVSGAGFSLFLCWVFYREG